MTKEEKHLLLIDLSARISYGVKCNAILKQIDGSLKSVFGTFKGYNGWATVGNNLVDIETVRPYLRPLSSMTEEEKKEYNKQVDIDLGRTAEEIKEQLEAGTLHPENKFTPLYCHIDWLNAHHFDYRGLIPIGLAIEAPEGMYKF